MMMMMTMMMMITMTMVMIMVMDNDEGTAVVYGDDDTCQFLRLFPIILSSAPEVTLRRTVTTPRDPSRASHTSRVRGLRRRKRRKMASRAHDT